MFVLFEQTCLLPQIIPILPCLGSDNFLPPLLLSSNFPLLFLVSVIDHLASLPLNPFLAGFPLRKFLLQTDC